MSLWQTQSWQDMLITSQQSEEYFVVEHDINNSKVTDKVYVEKRKVSLGEYGLFVIGFEGNIDKRLEESLEDLCREENCLFVQIETLCYSGITDTSLASWKPGFYKKFIPPYTAFIDLQKSEEEILADMKQKGRYNIRLAKKKGVEVYEVEKSSKNIQIFYELMTETTSRDSFAGNTQKYYEIFLRSLKNSHLYFAKHEDDLLAAGIFVEHGGVIIYYYGASSSQKRNHMAPYLLQWHVIESAKARGCTLYDFLGVAGDDEQDSSLTGVTDFKMKLSPKKHHVSESYIYINKKWKYEIIQLLKRVTR